MSGLDKLAASLGGAEKPGAQSVVAGVTWLVFYGGKKFGPHDRDELASMLATGMIDSTAVVWTEGWPNWKPVESVVPSTASKTPIDYATPNPRRTSGRIARYRRRVGHRSFVFQIWLLAWTISYVLCIASFLVSGASHNTPAAAAPFPGFNLPVPQANAADLATLITTGWLCTVLGWGYVGLPVGIAAVWTLENNK
jgi:hypothetical protein